MLIIGKKNESNIDTFISQRGVNVNSKLINIRKQTWLRHSIQIARFTGNGIHPRGGCGGGGGFENRGHWIVVAIGER